MEQSRSLATRDQRITTRVEEILDLLRALWVGSNIGLTRRNALSRIQDLKRDASPSNQTDGALDEIAATIRDLPQSESERKAATERIARDLKTITPLLGLDREGPEMGTMNTALRKVKPARSTTTGVPATGKRTLQLSDSVEYLKNVGPKNAEMLANLGIRTIGDLLRHAPRDHVDYSKPDAIGDPMRSTDRVVFRGTIRNLREIRGRNRKPRVEAQLRDNTGTISITWFNAFVAKQIKEGDEIVVRGLVRSDQFGFRLSPIEWEHTSNREIARGRLIPIYPLTKGLTQKRLRMWVEIALESTQITLIDWLGEIRDILEQAGAPTLTMPLDVAYRQLHFPDNPERLREARDRFAFESLLLLQIGLVQRKAAAKHQPGIEIAIDTDLTRLFRESLPFELTSAQTRVIREILGDMRSGVPMVRLLQGDVGSGKTVVAASAAFVVHNNQLQTALLAPTEILAEQHFRNLVRTWEDLPLDIRPNVELLTGSTRAKQRRQIFEDLTSGTTSVLVGTHAIIEPAVEFRKLGLVIIDEQHRFGVHQRGQLLQKAAGYTPHLLSMTATPIPKTLNHVVHGDLDVSIIDEMPPGRISIETQLLTNRQRFDAERLIRSEVADGRQVFVICPLVEDSDDEESEDEKSRLRRESKAAVSEAERLQKEVFPELRVDLVHGQMPSKKKDEVMSRFRDHAFDILVATSVIEVGIDIPNACVIMIEGADKFGLAQLHQLRGRVGRGAHRSYCLLMTDSTSNLAMERLNAVVSTSNGFVLAERDLELRGPGDFIGTRQSGLPEMGWVAFDTRMLDRANRAARAIVESTDSLDTRYPHLAMQLETFWNSASTLDTTQA